MALYIVDKNDKEHQAHVPIPASFIKLANTLAKLNEIELVQADGQELEYINQRFENLSTCYAICIWRGEMARFIAENLS